VLQCVADVLPTHGVKKSKVLRSYRDFKITNSPRFRDTISSQSLFISIVSPSLKYFEFELVLGNRTTSDLVTPKLHSTFFREVDDSFKDFPMLT